MIQNRLGFDLRRLTLVVGIVFLVDATVTAHSSRLNNHNEASHGVANASSLSDHDDALAARARGEIKSLGDILQSGKPRPNDRMVDVVLDHRDDRWIYEVTWLTKVGRYRIVTLDATDGTILKDETK